jgi:hypothetical protein
MQVIYQRARTMWGVYLFVLLLVSLVGGGGWAAVASYLGIDKAREVGQLVLLTWPLILAVAILPFLLYGLKDTGLPWIAGTAVLLGAMWVGSTFSGAGLEPAPDPDPGNIATLPFRVVLGFLANYGAANFIGAVLIGLVTPFAVYFVVKPIGRDPPEGPRIDSDAVWQRWIAEKALIDREGPAGVAAHGDPANALEDPPHDDPASQQVS